MLGAGAPAVEDTIPAVDDDTSGSDDDTALADSYRGVTADSIKVGVGILDPSRLGRRLEPVFATYSAIDTSSSDEACVTLTEDEEVFVGAAGPLRGTAHLDRCPAESADRDRHPGDG